MLRTRILGSEHVLALMALAADQIWRVDHAATCLDLESDRVLAELEEARLLWWLPHGDMAIARLTDRGQKLVSSCLERARAFELADVE